MYSKARAKFPVAFLTRRRPPDSRQFTLKGCPPHAEETLVRPKIRLDPVVKLEEQREELRLREMAEAGRRLKTAEDSLADTRARAGADERRPASAWDWQLAELSHTRALSDVRVAEQVVRAASEDSNVTRDRYSAAHSRAEAIRKVAEVRVGEIIQARDTAERREQDELAILRHGRRQAA
jgi:flagellar biosynthesis chaperone FliJ